MTGAPSNWGRFGPDDELGTLNLLTADAVLRGVASVRTGDRFPLNLPMALPEGVPGRPPFERRPLGVNAPFDGLIANEDAVTFALQGSSQWDALIHTGTAEPGVEGVFYNGFGTDAVAADGFAHHLGIERMAEAGIAGRGVLLDVARMVDGGGARPLPPDFVIDEDVVRRCLAHQGSAFEPGDIVCFRTGWTEAYLAGSPEERAAMIPSRADEVIPAAGVSPGLASMAHEQGWAAVTADNQAVDAMPPAGGWGRSCHVTMLRNLGMALAELLWFGDLAEAAAGDRRWEFLFVAVPLRVPGGAGSPANAMAIR